MDLHGQTIVITGASSGIGAAAARALQRRGARPVIVGRSPEATRRVAGELGADYHLADFARLADVRALAASLLERYPQIDVLANNAGGLMGDRVVTEDGHELTFQVNHLAPFLLTALLLDRLLASRARVINTASVGNTFGHIDLDDLENARGYNAFRDYGTAKLMNILHAQELQRRYGDAGLNAASFHPGVVATGFARAGKGPVAFLYTSFTRLFLISPQRGADTLVWLASGEPGRDWEGGGYYSRRKPGRMNSQADDLALAHQFYDASARLVGL
jgi:NAD(P)-dependent dehydrogenase (short-subunit alcohol dehydrogenase family)